MPKAWKSCSRGWLDKIAIVWALEEGTSVAPGIPEVHEFAKREFKICESPLSHPWGNAHAGGIERVIHYL